MSGATPSSFGSGRSLTVPGRHVAGPADKSEDPTQLSPAKIETLIGQNTDDWVKLAHGLHDAVIPALKAIEARNSQALSDAGGDIDQACESCHVKYWYPNDSKKSSTAQ